ncbi:MAG TPA: BON domain-containing protein [Azonexus sp.]|nr:BON domain-containing protein [Azonexus sp.]
MKHKISLSTLLLLGVLPLAAIANDPAPATGNPPAKESAGEYIDDTAITAKVKAAFVKDKTVKATEVKVETFKGTVQLSGFASSSAAIERATQLANEVAGVKAVRNDIRLKQP